MQCISGTGNTCGLFLFDQSLIQPARGCHRQDRFEDIDRRKVGVTSGRDMIDSTDHADFADPAQSHRSLAVLGWFFGICQVQLSFRFWNGSEILSDKFQCFFLFKPTCDDNHRVIGLIILFVELTQIFDGDSFNVRSVTDRRLAIIVPVESGTHNPLAKNLMGIILAPFKFIANNSHFRSQVFTLHITVQHAIRLESNGEFQIVIVGRQGLVIVRTIEPGRAVELSSSGL